MSKFKNVLIQLVLKVGFNLKVAQSQNILFKSAMQRYLIFAATMVAAVFAYGELPKLEAPTIYAPQYISPHRNTTLVRIAAGAGATVHYTLDGTTPTTGSSVYDGMIDLFNPKTIKAIAVKEGCQSSDVASFRVEKYEQTFEGGESFEVPVGWETVTRSFTVTEKSILRFKLVAESYYGSYYLGEFAYQVNLDGVYFASGYCSSSGPGDQQRDEVYTLDPGHYSITWTFYDYSGGFAGWVKDYAVERAPDSWDVYFDSMGGTRCHTQYYSGRSTFDSLPIPTREPGDEFLGWYWDSSSVQVNEGDSIDSADSTIILWAKWQNIDKALDPAAKFSVCRAQAGQWTESNETLVSYVEDQPLASGESRLVLSYTIDGKALVTMRVFDDGADMASKVYVDDNPIVLYNGKFDIQSEGSHKIEVRAVGQEDNAKLSIRIGRITAEQLPDSVIINLDPNGGTCSKTSIEYRPGMSFGSLPVPVLAGCDFVGWQAENGDLVAPATPVSMACTKLTAQWKVSPLFLDPDEVFDIELNTSCNWIVQSGSSLYCLPPEDGFKSTDEPLLTLHVSGAGLLMMSSLDWRVNVRVDGKLADLVDRTIPLKRDENGSIVSIFGDTVCEILADGEHTVTFHASYLGGNWSCYLHPMRWQALGEAIEIKLDPAEGSVGKSNIVCNVGGVYGELPVPVCEWGDFVGWYLDACDGFDQSDRQFVDKDTRVSNLYTTLRAAYKVNGRLVDPQGNFDITMCDDGAWSAENIVDRTANWKSRTYYQYDGERPGRKTIMTFVPKQSGILLIDGVRIEGGWMDRLNVKAYIGVETSQYSVDGPWLNLACSDWDSSEGVELRDCYGYQYRVGVDYIERCPLFVNAGQEYKVIVDMTAVFDRWDVNDFWAGMSIGKFEFEPFLPVTLFAGEHGKFAVGSSDQAVVWCRYSDGPWQQQLKNMSVYMNYDKGWTRTDWEIVGDGQMSAASAIAVYGPAAYEAWYIFDSHYDFPVGTFLPAGSWKHASTYYSYAQNHYNQCSISGFYVSTNENDRVPNVCLLGKDNSTNWIENVVSGPCKVTFDWKVSSEGFHNYKIDYFSFSVDGVEKDWIGGEVDWASREFEISGTGEHTLRWSYVKDESGAEGEDCGRVANIVIVPLVEIAFQASGQEEYGNPPSAFWLYEGETAPLPGAASLVWPRHELAGWSDGKKTYAVGENYLAGAASVSLVAIWSEKRQPDPVIQVPERFEAKETQVIMTADAGSAIYYTLDGSEPNESSSRYDGPFSVDCSCVIKAIAIRADWFDSEVVSASTVKAGYAVTFNPGMHGKLSGDVSAQQSVLHGEAAIAPTVTADEWYSFIGWDKAFDCVTADMTVTAMYGLAPRSVEDVECYAYMGLSGKNVAAYLDGESRDGCMILLGAADSFVEMKVSGYCRVSCQVRPNVCEVDGAIRIKVDGELYSVVREAGLAVVELNGEGLHTVQWSGLGEVGDFEITEACLISFAGEFGEKGKFPDPIPLYEGETCQLPFPDGVTYEKHTFKCWRCGSNMRFAGEEIIADVNSMTFYAVWEENRLNDPIIVAGDYFEGESMTVEIASDEFAEVHYTTDGSVPSDSSPIYAGSFTVNQSCVIKAIAVRENWYASGVSVKQITRGPWTFGEYLGVSDMTFTTGGNAEWFRAKGEGPDCSYALKSGHIGNSQLSYLRTTLTGAGVIRFSYRVSSEAYKQFIDDGLVVYLDGVANLGMFGGNTGWQTAEIRVPSGEHVIAWSYEKSGSDERDVGSDCAWLANVEWLPDALIPSVENLREVFGESSSVAQAITDSDGLTAFNKFLSSCGVISTSALTLSQKQYAYQSFKLSEITTAPQLFEEEPVLKIDDMELTSGNLSLTISLTAGVEAIQLAKNKLAEKIRVGTAVDAIDDLPNITTRPTSDGASLTFVVRCPGSSAGFVKIKIE